MTCLLVTRINGLKTMYNSCMQKGTKVIVEAGNHIFSHMRVWVYILMHVMIKTKISTSVEGRGNIANLFQEQNGQGSKPIRIN